MPALQREIRVYARHPLVVDFIRSWNRAQRAPLYIAGPSYHIEDDNPDVVENTAPWDRMEDARARVLEDHTALREARYLMLSQRTGLRFNPPPAT